jgi:hypothetical protein
MKLGQPLDAASSAPTRLSRGMTGDAAIAHTSDKATLFIRRTAQPARRSAL